MIILSGVLVVLAIALLVAGIVAGADGVGGVEGLTLIYISIGISVVSALCLAIGVFLRRRELFGATGAVVPPRGKTAKSAKATKPGRAARKAQQAREAQLAKDAREAEAAGVAAPAAEPAAETVEDAGGPVALSAPTDVPSDAAVYVVRGRKRYHLDNCRQLAGRDREELTYAEALEEGFSPCTACMPDTALAARAAVAVGESGTVTAVLPVEPRGGTEADVADVTVTDLQAEAPAAGSGRSERSAEDPLGVGPRSAAEPYSAPASSWESDADDPLSPASRSWMEAAPPAGDRVDWASDRAPSSAAADPLGGSWRTESAERPEPLDTWRPDPAAGEPEPALPAWATDDEPAEAAEPAVPESAESAESAAQASPTVRILSGTKRYHRPDCALIEDIGEDADDLESLSRDQAKDRGCTPCLVCQPDKDPAHP